MNIFDLLKNDHRQIADLLSRLKTMNASGDVRERFDQLQEMLEQHSLGEEKLFYPLVEAKADDEDLIAEARSEHERVDQVLSEMDDLEPGTDVWRERLDDLSELISAHVEMEETEIFAEARKVLGEDDANRIGAEMQRREGIVRDNRPEASREGTAEAPIV